MVSFFSMIRGRGRGEEGPLQADYFTSLNSFKVQELLSQKGSNYSDLRPSSLSLGGRLCRRQPLIGCFDPKGQNNR